MCYLLFLCPSKEESLVCKAKATWEPHTQLLGRQETPQNSCWSPRLSPAVAHCTWRESSPLTALHTLSKNMSGMEASQLYSQGWRRGRRSVPRVRPRAAGSPGAPRTVAGTAGQSLPAGSERRHREKPQEEPRSPMEWEKGNSWAKTLIHIYLYLHTVCGVWKHELVWLLISTPSLPERYYPSSNKLGALGGFGG